MSRQSQGPESPDGSIAIPPEALRDVREWLDLKMRTGTYSLGLAGELAFHMVHRLYHVHLIYDEIGILECSDDRPSRTVKAKKFSYEPLIGFWRKHHFQPYFMAKNLANELRKKGFLDNILRKYVEQNTEYFVGKLAHDIVLEPYTQRHAHHNMTGEWIIYEKRPDDSNYYLCLGSHADGNEEDKQRHYQMLRDKIDSYKRLDNEVT